ncbi:MAG: biotin/lipoyl-containing protein, partial [Spirochaetota bacterium]
PNAIAAPLAGIIVQVPVQSGAQVKAGDVVVVLEAMKMATNLASPRDGKIKAVLVAKGQNVKQGDILVELE